MQWERIEFAALLLFAAGLTASTTSAHDARPKPQEVIRVGPTRLIKTIAEAAKRAVDGDTVEVDSGVYTGDVAVWSQNNLNVRAVGGRVRLLAAGVAAEAKSIWVIRGGRITVEGFDFEDAKVPDHNGAGIRFERGFLVVRDCIFIRNEMGLLTGNHPDAELVIENSEFAYNRRPDGHNHNLYVGRIARLTVSGSYFHHGYVGHLLKSRAAVNHITYNRLTDEAEGRASYELEFPDGGVAYIVGNVIGQSSFTENPILISFGAEGYKWPTNEIYLVNNTLLDHRLYGGVFLRVKPGADTVTAINNLWLGAGRFESTGRGEFRNNFNVELNAFESGTQGNYRLRQSSHLVGRAVNPGSASGQDLRPYSEYAHPRGTKKLDAPARNPGAMQHTRQLSN